MESQKSEMDLSSQSQDEQKKTGYPEYCEIHNEQLTLGTPACESFVRLYCVTCEEIFREKRIKEREKKRRIRDLALPKRFEKCTFENFIIDSQKKKTAVDICRKFISLFPDVGGMAFIGGVGTGKTHLASAIALHIVNIEKNATIVTASQIIRRVRSSWGGKSGETEDEVIYFFSSRDLLVIDEIGAQYGTESEKIIISEIVNNRYGNMLPTIVIGNTTLSELKAQVGERAVDRIIDDGFLVPFSWESNRKESTR